MAVTTEIPWGDGTGDKLYFTREASEGNQTVLVSSDANAGAERSKNVIFSAQGVEPKSLGVIQLSGGPTREFDDWVKDGDTHLWIDIVNDFQKPVDIRIRMIGTIDWGDGSAKDTANVTAYTTFSHTYADKGRYRIDLHPTSGTFYIGNATNGINVMGTRTNYYKTSALYQVELGSSIITTISAFAFYYCLGLRKVYIPKNITAIDQQAFAYCRALTQIKFEDASKITSVNNSSFFYQCYALQDIGEFAPSWGTNLSNTIRECSSLTEFRISSGVTSIAVAALNNASALRHLWVYPATPPTVANANAFTFGSSCVIHVPNGKLSAYQSANIWSNYASQMVEMPAA